MSLSLSADVTVVVNANRAGGAWTSLSMLLESLGLSGVPADRVLVVARGGGVEVPDGVRAVEAPDRGEVTGLLHVAESPHDVATRWIAYLQDTMVVGPDFAGLAVDTCTRVPPGASAPACITLDGGAGFYDAAWLSSLAPRAPRSLQDVLDACPPERRRRLDSDARDTGTFRQPGDAQPPRRIAWYPCVDLYEFV